MRRYAWRTGTLEFAMLIAALAFLFPIYRLVNLSIRPIDDLSSPVKPTTGATLDNFKNAWNQADLGSAILNSTIITVVSVALLVALSATAAYPIARSTARWSSVTFYCFMVGLLLPFQLALVPLYKTMQDLGLVGTTVPLMVIYVGTRLPFSIFLYVQFIRQTPRDYEEAASIDGATPLQTLFRIVFPLVRPVTATVAILNGLFVWNDFFQPLLYLSGTGHQTVPVAIYTFVGEFSTDWELVFAALAISIIPILAAFFFIQNSLIRGLSGGVKG